MTGEDLTAFAGLCARAVHNGRPLFRDFERPDRVFLTGQSNMFWRPDFSRASLELPSAKLVATNELLGQIASEDWVCFRYGESPQAADRGAEREDDSRPSEHVARTSIAAVYELQPEADPAILKIALHALAAQPLGNRPRIMDTLLSGPNLFLPLGDALQLIDQVGQERIQRMRTLIFGVTARAEDGTGGNGPRCWTPWCAPFFGKTSFSGCRGMYFRGEDETWSESLLRGLHQTCRRCSTIGAGRRPCRRVPPRIVGDGRGGAGSTLAVRHENHSRLGRARDRIEQGDRDAIFSGFNTPLLPDILVCTR